MAAIAESCAIARREGIEPEVLYELLTASTGDSRVLRTRFPLGGVDDAHPASRGFAPLFALDLIAKDMELGLDARRRARASSPRRPRAALDAYRHAQREGRGALDYSAVYLRFDAAEGGE